AAAERERLGNVCIIACFVVKHPDSDVMPTALRNTACKVHVIALAIPEQAVRKVDPCPLRVLIGNVTILPFSIVEHAKAEPVCCSLPVDVGGVDVVPLAIAQQSNSPAGKRPVAERCTLCERQIMRLVAEDIEERTRRRVVIV